MAARKVNAFSFDLSKPNKKGTLMKQGGLHKAFKYRFFILYPGFLVYYDSETKWKSDLTKGDTLGNRIGAIKLKNGTVNVARDSPKGCKFGLIVHAPDPLNKRQSYLLNGLNKEDRDEWITAIRGSIPHSKNQKPAEGGSQQEPPREEERRSPRPAGIMRQDTASAAAILASENEADEMETSMNDIGVRHTSESKETEDSQATENRLTEEQEEKGSATGISIDEAIHDYDEHDQVISQALGEKLNGLPDSEESESSSTPDLSSPTPEMNGLPTSPPPENTDNAPEEPENSSEALPNGDISQPVEAEAKKEESREQETEEKAEGEKPEVGSHIVDCKEKEEEEEEGETQPMELEKTVESSMNIEGKVEVVTSVKVVSSPSPSPSLNGHSKQEEGDERREIPAELEANQTQVKIKEEAAAWTVTLVRDNAATPSDSSDDEGDPDIPTLPPPDEFTASSPASISDTPTSVSDVPPSASEGTSSESGNPAVQIDKVNTLPREERNSTEAEEDIAAANALSLRGHRRKSSTPFIEKRGFLYKEGGQRKTWKLRYFVLQPGHFTYYKHSPNTKPLGEVKLKNLQIRYPGVGERKQSFQFTVHTESSWNKRNDYIIAAQTDAEMKEWIAAFKLAGQKNIGGSSVSPSGSDEENTPNS